MFPFDDNHIHMHVNYLASIIMFINFAFNNALTVTIKKVTLSLEEASFEDPLRWHVQGTC